MQPGNSATELGGEAFFRNHRICSGPKTAPGASLVKLISSVLLLLVRKSWPKPCWLTPVLRHGACFLETRSRGIATTSIPEVRRRDRGMEKSAQQRWRPTETGI